MILEVPKKPGIKGFWENLRRINPQLAIAYAGLALMGLAVLAAFGMYLYQILTR